MAKDDKIILELKAYGDLMFIKYMDKNDISVTKTITVSKLELEQSRLDDLVKLAKEILKDLDL